jgi:hypothetical protein
MEEKKIDECMNCIEGYNKVSHKKIICCYCSYDSCHRCVQRYILSQIQDPHCMKCKKIWSREFIDNQLTKQFINTELKQHRENILFEKEKNLLPDTQDNVRLLHQQEEIEREMKSIEIEMGRLQQKFDELERQRNDINPYCVIPRETIKRIRIPCITDHCRGFIEETEFAYMRCGICSIVICSKCRETYDTQHKCNPDIIRTIQVLDKETKRCPSCMIPIFKINGCGQMWCTCCHIAFDWKTGERVRGIIHNPHYHEYIEQHGIGQLRKRRDQSYHRFEFLDTDRILHVLMEQQSPELTNYQVIEVYRYVIHYYDVDLQRLPTRFDQTVNLDLRMQYLQHQITEEEFKNKLQRRQKDIEKKIEYRDIGETYVDIMNDMFISFIETKDVQRLLSEIKSITSNTQDAITSLNKRYQSNMPLVRTLL